MRASPAQRPEQPERVPQRQEQARVQGLARALEPVRVQVPQLQARVRVQELAWVLEPVRVQGPVPQLQELVLVRGPPLPLVQDRQASLDL